ncbi:WD40-repeat-containing domain protein [Rhodotorula diobovata]|uniref:DNA damage-binding protein CMR1 n=1 Tax=Rhodotorula diobovata TaxID=5288 RepID=A0A5C5FM66_9BASI|nr:WD40-repeat-containing domain protein [Rhodotorula diobovata]
MFDIAAFRKGQAKQIADLVGDAADTAASLVPAAAPKPKPSKVAPKASSSHKKKAAPAKRKADDADLAPSTDLRRSSRRNPARGAKLELERLEAQEAEERARRKHGDRALEAREGGVSDALGQDSLNDMLDELARYDIASEAGEPKWTLGTRPKADPKRLKDQAQPWDLRAIVKIIPDRIYSMTVHPDPARSIVFAGDKNGHIACWDATDAGKLRPGKEAKAIRDGDAAKGGEAEDDEDEEDERQWGKWWHWKAHADSSVSFLKFRPGDRNALYSSSYDGTLRATHFEHKQSEEVLDASRWNRDTLVHSFDFDATGNELWASDDDGGLLFRDLRTPKDTTKRWEIDAYKVGCVSLNPANPGLAATAHLKRFMGLWDLSTIRGLPEDTDHRDLREKALVTGFETKYACSSAYFDPTGTRLATTSYDDMIRLWDIEPTTAAKELKGQDNLEPTEQIHHNTQVGRYVTVLRAHWSQVPSLPPHLFTGDMHRTVTLYSPGAAKPVRTFADEALTAVPAVTAAHPTREGRYFGGAASGKVSFWTEELPEDV